ncbi:AAA family ATPase [Rhodohalobacter sp. SW132]|uniref:AAA family ATPase n=1 Tax=Rhodohalobacter sp. SW132 TaxID=2293433 RepID=UPI0013151A9F|nr:AAA family ATPase [Rhodohalobacter sp. SW132]
MANDNLGVNSSTRLELMSITGKNYEMGIKFHIFVRGRMPSLKEFLVDKKETWKKIRNKIETNYQWLPEHHFTWSEVNHLGQSHNHYGIHLKGGVTIFCTDTTQRVKMIYDYNSDDQLVDELITMFNKRKDKPKNRVGLIQASCGTLNVKFVEYRPYELEITPFLGEEIGALKQEMLQSFKDETKSGLYLIHGKPGTGKTSFLKEILTQTDKQALFIPPSIAGELGNPNLISLLMDHSDSIIIIEDAETVLMTREADNSDAVSNLLNLTDGFPSDFLNLNIICTFNTDIQDIDPALLRKGRLRGIQVFKELSIEQAQKLADNIGSGITIDRKMTVAEISNESFVNSYKLTGNGIGFNGSK